MRPEQIARSHATTASWESAQSWLKPASAAGTYCLEAEQMRMREMRTAEQIVLDAFPGRSYVTIIEVIGLVEALIAAADGADSGTALAVPGRRGRGAH
jgi:hypothetical protein